MKPSNKLALYSMLQNGFAIKQENRRREQEANPGADWRGGNSGCITEDGVIIGESPRKAILRHLGIEMPTTLDDDLIFEAGFKNEEHWSELLTLANVPHKEEEDIPISWALPNGETVGGRPDIVIGSRNTDSRKFVPEFGVELKLISSNGKMMRHAHFGEANPISYHVCQAAHYSSKMGIDWVLAYTNRAHFTAFYWGPAKWKFNQTDSLPHRACLTDPKNGKVISVAPFISMYDITWDGDTMLMDGKPTIITASGVERFYQYCSDCIRDKIIPPHGSDVDIWGKKEAKGSHHPKYDEYAEANEDDGFDQWILECRDIAEAAR